MASIKKILKGLIYIILFSFIVACCSKVPKIPKPQKSYPNYLQSYIHIINLLTVTEMDLPVGPFSGTGSIVEYEKQKYILTAAHVCRPQEFAPEGTFGDGEVFTNKIMAYNWEGKEIEVAFIKHDIELDICLLSYDAKKVDLPALKLADKPPQIGEKVINLGSPHGYWSPPAIPIFHGVYSGLDEDGLPIYSIHIGPGSSGGPILNEKKQLVAVVTAAFIFDMNIAIATNVDNVKEFIASSE